MNKELQETLYSKYPYLFSNKDKSAMETCMCWGVECGNGWFEILLSLCSLINDYEENNKKDKEEYYKVKFNQIKEKYGGLRVYFSGGDEYVEGLVSMAEALSYKTCEQCGNPGRPNEQGWISTLCSKCRNKSY